MAGVLVPFLAAGAAGLLLTPLVRRLATRAGLVARPKADRWHRDAVPLLGGVAIWLAVALASLAGLAAGGAAFLPGLIIGSIMFAVGLVDDVLPLKPSTKIIAQVTAVCGFLLFSPTPVWVGVPALDILITILWFIGITNAFNLLDNMDGLCAGIAAIAAISLALSVGATNPGMLAYSAALAGAALAFLVFNFNPASIFMGDSGSLFLGASLAVLTMVDTPRAHAGLLSALAVPVILLLLPIFDIVFVTLSRKLSARAASVGGRDHTSHRLVALGFTERQAVLLCYGLAASAGAAAFLLGRRELREANALAGILIVGFLLLAVQLARVKVYEGTDYRLLRDSRYTPLLLDVTYKRRLFEVFLDVSLFALAYYLAYVIRFDDEFPSFEPLFLKSLPVVIAAQLLSCFVVGVYRGVWRYFTIADLPTYLKGLTLGTFSSVLALVYLYRFEGFSRGVFIINIMTAGLLVTGSRASFRLLGDVASRYRQASQRALICGAGDGGALVVRELRNNLKYDCRPVGFIDDDPSKQQRKIMGIPVLGTSDELEQLIAQERPDMLIVSTHKLQPARLAAIRQVCFDSGTPLFQLRFSLDPLHASPLRRES